MTGRWASVRILAWAMRRGFMTPAEALEVTAKAFPHRDAAWRLALVNEAVERNGAQAG